MVIGSFNSWTLFFIYFYFFVSRDRVPRAGKLRQGFINFVKHLRNW